MWHITFRQVQASYVTEEGDDAFSCPCGRCAVPLRVALLDNLHLERYETGRFVSQTSPAHRPALVTFAAIMLILLGGFELVIAITEFFRFAWGTLPNIADVLNYSIFWGILDVLYGLVLLYAGYVLLQGQAVGRLIALIVAVFAAIRWFFYLWYVPWASAVVIGICLLIIYGLVSNEEYFLGS
jgi:hypothetical protein